jgi:hypothetical protein
VGGRGEIRKMDIVKIHMDLTWLVSVSEVSPECKILVEVNN